MNIEQLKYGKVNAEKELKPASLTVSTTKVVSQKHPSSTLPSNYSKQEGKIEVRIIFILSGGEDILPLKSGCTTMSLLPLCPT